MEEICINPKEICFKRNNFDQLQEIKILNNSPNKKEIVSIMHIIILFKLLILS